MNKKAERFAKTTLLKKDGQQLSAIEPNTYQTRFCDILCNRMLTMAESERAKESKDAV
jgi:hypothetical protein